MFLQRIFPYGVIMEDDKSPVLTVEQNLGVGRVGDPSMVKAPEDGNGCVVRSPHPKTCMTNLTWGGFSQVPSQSPKATGNLGLLMPGSKSGTNSVYGIKRRALEEDECVVGCPH